MKFSISLFAVACDPATDCSGHGTCNAQGECDCNEGFLGDDCSGKINIQVSILNKVEKNARAID